MKLSFAIAEPSDAAELAGLRNAAAEELTRRYGVGSWSGEATERGVLFGMRHGRVVIVRQARRIAGTLLLQSKKPWAIDIGYFSPVKKAIYLTNMAIRPGLQRRGIGRALLEEAERQVATWPADAIRLDAFDAPAGAGGFYFRCGFREVGRVTYRNAPLIYFERLVAVEENPL